jgi:hypothetical protein
MKHMDTPLPTAKDRVKTVLLQASCSSLQISLDKRKAACELLNKATGDAKATAERIYAEKVAAAKELLETTIAPARALRDEAVKPLLEALTKEREAPDALFNETKQAAEKVLQEHAIEYEKLRNLAAALALEQFEVALEFITDPELIEQARLALHKAKRLAHEKYMQDCESAQSIFYSTQKEAGDQWRLITKPLDDAYRAAVAEHDKVFDLVNLPAQKAYSEAFNSASEERQKSHKEIHDADQEQFRLIQEQYAAERRLRVVALRVSEIMVEAFFNWRNKVAPPAESAEELPKVD